LSLNPFAVLRRHPNFRNFWIGQTVSQVGTWMSGMAQGWLALVLSDDPLMVGLVAAAPAVPIIVLSLPAGVLVDRTDKLKLVRICQALMMLDAAAMWYLTWSRHVTVWWLLGLSFLFGAVAAVEIPARQAMQLDLVNREDLRAAIALNSSGFNLARIAGPSVAALVIANIGLAWCFALNAASFAAVLGGLSRIRLPAHMHAAHAATPRGGIGEAVAYLRGQRLISGLLGLVAVYGILGGAYIPLMPVIAREQLGVGASRYGLLLSSVGVGGLAGALFLAGVGARLPRGRLLRWSATSFPLALVALSTLQRANFAYPVLFAAGVLMILNGAGSNSILQQLVEDRMRGRIMALYALLVVGLSNAVGAPFAGWVARHVGVHWAIAGMATVMLAYSLWAFRRWPEMGKV
jgi:MFS family permease